MGGRGGFRVIVGVRESAGHLSPIAPRGGRGAPEGRGAMEDGIEGSEGGEGGDLVLALGP